MRAGVSEASGRNRAAQGWILYSVDIARHNMDDIISQSQNLTLFVTDIICQSEHGNTLEVKPVKLKPSRDGYRTKLSTMNLY